MQIQFLKLLFSLYFQIRHGCSEVSLKYTNNNISIKQKNAEVVTDTKRIKSLFVIVPSI